VFLIRLFKGSSFPLFMRSLGWFFSHAHQLFDEMCMRLLVACWLDFGLPKSHR
jgi:hypothetical protein